MHLKRLEVQGFKSFADKIEMVFEKGITGVVGPNGSGKSNISDSIRWVLGEQSAKTLRGSKMEDIIFNGTASRKPLGMAEVSITLDNSTKALPIEYGEVTITRRVYRSGESEYFLNKSSCRLKDIRELLMDTGIGKDGYSIIGQGRIDEILSNKSEDRRQVFEEAAGIVKYKSRKEEATKKLTATKENLDRVLDIVHELEVRLEPLKKQSDKAKLYNEIREKLIKLEVNLFIREIDKIDGELKHILEQTEMLKKSLGEQQHKKQSLAQDIGTKEKLIEEHVKEIDRLQEQYHFSQNQMEKKEGLINVCQEKFLHCKENADRVRKEIGELNGSDGMLKKQLEEKLNHLNHICTELDEMKKKLKEKEGLFQELSAAYTLREQEVEQSKGYIIDILNEISNKKSDHNSLLTLIGTMDSRICEIESEMEKYNEKLRLLQENSKALGEEYDQIHRNIEGQLVELQGAEDRKRELYSTSLAFTKEIEGLRSKLNHANSRKSILEEMEKEHEGFNKSVKNILNACKKNTELGKGIYGVVADLISVPKGYEVAIETALGPAIQNIVSQDENDGKRVIQYLKKYNLGRVTILPITSIKGRSISQEERSLIQQYDQVKIAYDIVSFSQTFEGICSNLLSRTLIAPNLDIGIEIARKLSYRFKVVTIDGDVINMGGALTGGSAVNKGVSILGRRRELEELVSQIHITSQSLQENEGRLQHLEEQTKELTGKTIALQEDIQKCRIAEATLKSKVDQSRKEEEETSQLIKQREKEIRQLGELKEETTGKQQRLEKEIEGLNEKITTTQTAVGNTQQQLLASRGELEALGEERTKDKIAQAAIDEKKKGILYEIESFQLTIKNNHLLLESKTKELAELSNQSKVYEEEQRKNQQSLKYLRKEMETLEEKIANIKGVKEKQLSEESQLKSQVKGVEEIIAELQESFHKLDVKRTRLEVQQQAYYNKLWEEYELTYNTAISLRCEMDETVNANREIRDLKDKMKSLGTINQNAIEEYEEVKERYGFLKQQQEDLHQAQASLVNVIEDMEETMRKQFISQFEIIRHNFNVVFNKLFGGGKADLLLEDQGDILQCGIDIIAQPPGKKLQSLSLLSGGERALTAIALLFAILLVKPSPFCILDEIEAALDDANVYRFAQFLRELCEKTQFIVVTHRKGTMENTDTLYGITMEEEGVSKLVSVKLIENEKDNQNEIAS